MRSRGRGRNRRPRRSSTSSGTDRSPVIFPGIEHFAADAGEVRLHCAAAGPRDGPLVVLLHGFPECWISWRHQLPTLAAAGFRAVAPDLRGYGGWGKPPRAAAPPAAGVAPARDRAGFSLWRGPPAPAGCRWG